MFNPYENHDDHQPVTWVRGYPVYAAHLIVAVFVASMIATTIALAAGANAALAWLPFNSGSGVARGNLARAVLRLGEPAQA